MAKKTQSSRKVNTIWHEKNKLRTNTSRVKAVEWHQKHMKYCGCKATSSKMRKILELVKIAGKDWRRYYEKNLL